MKTYTLKPLNDGPKHELPENFDAELNPAQKDAVYFDKGPLLLIAGAGSGKTKTLVHRVARLVHEGVPPEAILLLTFTRKSAKEMLDRASRILDNRCHDVAGGTFHGFGNIILRQYAKHIGYNNEFTILDRGDAEDLINMVRKEQNWPTGDKRFPKKGTIATVIGKAINTGKSIESILSRDFPQFLDFVDEINTIAVQYQIQKKAMNAMDYDDLLTQTLHLLQTVPEVRETLRNQYQYIMVDEYQDTNLIQAQLIKALINDEQNIMVVGDDSQSIYSFRGADFKNIMSFPDLFPGATVIKLEQNYRSSQSILDLTNAVIAQAQEKFTKNLFTDKDAGTKPIFIETESDNHQSRFICQKILELREEGKSLNDIAVLMRSGWHSNDLEIELKAHNIPFVKHGGFKFIESSHVKDVIAYLKLIFNPSEKVSWLRILLLFEGLGPKGASKLADEIKLNVTTPNRIPIDRYKTKPYFKELQHLIQLVFMPSQKSKKPSQLMSEVLTFYNPIFKSTYDNFNKRQTDLDSLEAITEKYQDLETLLSEMSLDPPTAEVQAIAEDHEDEVLTLSTIHSAKGLEWDTVFLISAVDGYLPSFQSLGDAGQLEEERRLMYVALTRAESNLFIIKPNLDLSQSNYYRYSGLQFSKPSRFIQDYNILTDYTEKWALEEEKKPQSIGMQNSYNYDPAAFKKNQSKPKNSKYSAPVKRYTTYTQPEDVSQELSEDDFRNPGSDNRRYYF